MNITQIFDLAFNIQFVEDATHNVIILKEDIKLELRNDLVIMYDKSTSNAVNQGGNTQLYNLDYQKITFPIFPNALTLELYLSNLINSIPAVAPPDYSTASNQLVQIIQVDDGSPELSAFKDLNGSVFKELSGAPRLNVFVDPTSGLSWLRLLKNLEAIRQEFDIIITRPANVIPYTIGDAINDVVPIIFKFTGAGLVNQGLANLVGIKVFDNANVGVKPIFNYFFFSQQQPIQADNVPIALPDIPTLNDFLGSVNGSTITSALTPVIGAGGNSVQTLIVPNGGLKMITNSPDIYCIIGLANAYVPVSGEQFRFTFRFQ